ncbi:MAG TPA: penicillin-binding transpeptidase domain-containing protein [Trebonia sp.]
MAGASPVPGAPPVPEPAPAPATSGRPSGSHRKPSKRKTRRALLSKRQKTAGALVVTVGVLGAGFLTGFGTEPTPEPAVQAFLLDWQQGAYNQAAALTTGDHGQVQTQLAGAFSDLDATAAFLSLGTITQHGNTGQASFKATVDIDQGEHQWTYQGQMDLVRQNGQWLVSWAPSVVYPGLTQGERLAMVSSYPSRAQVEDDQGQPLQQASVGYRIGVYPAQVKNPAKTAADVASIAGLDSKQVLGQVQAAPPRDFLSLVTLSSSQFATLWPRLSQVPGVTFQRKSERLFTTDTNSVVGSVGTENSSVLRQEGAAYEPGNTVGESGLEQAYQDELVGTPTTSVVMIKANGDTGATLWTSPGHTGTPVQTTINTTDQNAASQALAQSGGSGEIVAVDASTGGILALDSSQSAGGTALPSGGALGGKIQPGMAFSIVSAAAMLGDGVQPSTPLPCYSSEAVGGQKFTYTGGQTPSTFASDFASGCGTAFASMSTKLSPARLASTEKSFGIGTNWNLQLSSFSGSAATASAGASLAAQAIGSSGVLMSPLGMALVAAEVDDGTGHSPVLIKGETATRWRAPLASGQLSELRQMMREAVTSGSAQGADTGSKQVYGQAGVIQTGPHTWLSWFVGYQGTTAVAALSAGASPEQAASSLAASFLSSAS